MRVMTAGPTLLVVDDKLEDAADYIELFEELGGFTVITARTRDEAQRRVAAHPGVEAVSTDVSLSSEGIDIDGAILAMELSLQLPGIPIAGYSGFRGLTDLPDEYQPGFRYWLERGASATKLSALVEQLHDDALQYRSLRAERAHTDHSEFKLPSALADAVFELVGGAEADLGTQAQLSDQLAAAGFRLRAVMPVFEAGSSLRAKSPVACWVRGAGRDWEGEVIGQPRLYSTGTTEAEVLSSLVELIEVFADRLEVALPADERTPRTGPAEDLTQFIETIIERR